MKLLRLAPENTKFPFMRFRRVSYPFSAVLSIAVGLLFLIVGMNFGIDFAGGTMMDVKAKSGFADLAYIRDLSEPSRNWRPRSAGLRQPGRSRDSFRFAARRRHREPGGGRKGQAGFGRGL